MTLLNKKKKTDCNNNNNTNNNNAPHSHAHQLRAQPAVLATALTKRTGVTTIAQRGRGRGREIDAAAVRRAVHLKFRARCVAQPCAQNRVPLRPCFEWFLLLVLSGLWLKWLRVGWIRFLWLSRGKQMSSHVFCAMPVWIWTKTNQFFCVFGKNNNLIYSEFSFMFRCCWQHKTIFISDFFKKKK